MRTANQFLILAVIATIFTFPVHAKDTSTLGEEPSQSLIGQPLPELAGIDKLYVGMAINRQYVGMTPELDDSSKTGPAWKKLEREVMNRLLESDIKVVGNIKTVIKFGLNISELSELRIDIDMLKLKDSQQHLFHIQTCISRNVILKYYPALGLRADVWKSNPVMQAVPTQNVPAEVAKVTLAQVDGFIADYRLANPPGSKFPDAKDITAIPPVVTSEQTKPVVKPITAKQKFVASKNSKVFHKPDCRWAQRIKPINLITFSTRDQAIQAGKRPCKQCKP